MAPTARSGRVALDDRRHAGSARAREPFCDGAEWLVVVGPEQRLQEDSEQPVATDAEPPELVGGVAQIVGNGGSLPTLHHGARAFGEISLEATAADEAAIVAVRREQDSMPGFAVSRARSLIDGSEHERLAGLAPSMKRLQKMPGSHAGSRATLAGQYASAVRRLHHPASET